MSRTSLIFLVVVATLFALGLSRPPRSLICPTTSSANETSDANRLVGQFLSNPFAQTCPEAFTFDNKIRQASHMCVASNSSSLCIFHGSNIVITKEGAWVDRQTGAFHSFRHPSIAKMGPLYFPHLHDHWANYYTKFANHLPQTANLPTQKLVCPIRMIWDDCFNHLSFQTLPLIGLVYETQQSRWNKISWHSSLFSAALLTLLGVPEQRIFIERPVIAEELVLPWIPGWCPVLISSLKGVANRVATTITQNLLAKYNPLDTSIDLKMATYSRGFHHSMDPKDTKFLDDMPPPMSENEIQDLVNSKDRLILYLPRSSKSTRSVVNDEEIVKLLRENLNEGYRLVIIAHTKEFKTIEALHRSWYRYAYLFSRAKVIIGPHGGAMNNMMWVPRDCHLIEFNEFPDDHYHTSATASIAKKAPVRPVFLAGWWALGNEGKFWVIEPSMRHPNNLYEGRLRVAPFELFAILEQIPGVLPTGFSHKKFSPESHGFWPKPN